MRSHLFLALVILALIIVMATHFFQAQTISPEFKRPATKTFAQPDVQGQFKKSLSESPAESGMTSQQTDLIAYLQRGLK